MITPTLKAQMEAMMLNQTGKTTDDPTDSDWEPYGTSADPAHDVESLSRTHTVMAFAAVTVVLVLCGVGLERWYLLVVPIYGMFWGAFGGKR